MWIIFADGASSGNPGPGGWGALVLSPSHQVTELGGGAKHTTNNRMELSAIIAALNFIQNTPKPLRGKIQIYTDSSYVVKGITEYLPQWQNRGWKTTQGSDVMNRDLWEQLEKAVQNLPHSPIWTVIPGHSGIPGNERADEIAVAYSQGEEPDLYEGPSDDYSVSFSDLTPRRTKPKKKKNTGPAFSYLSLVDGIALKHQTWSECEARVKGRSGAKFKKAISADDEKTILKEWGIKT